MTNYNIKFNEATTTLKSARELRAENVTEMIDELITNSKEYKKAYDLSNKKAITILFNIQDDKEYQAKLDEYTKRVYKVARAIIKDGYKINHKYLTLAQMENLTKFNKNVVNKRFSDVASLKDKLSAEALQQAYVDDVKLLIDSAKEERTTKVFSPKKAKEIKE